MGKRRNYSDEFRANAVLLLEAAGYPDKLGSLMSTAKRLGVPDRTLSRWYKAEQNPPPDKVVNEKRRDLTELFRDEIEAALLAAGIVREDASYRDLMTGVGIMTDKLQLLSNKPTERVDNAVTLRVVYDDGKPELNDTSTEAT